MLQRIRNILQVTWRGCYNVSGTSWKLLEEDVTTYHEPLASYLKKTLQRIRNVLQVTYRRCYNAAGYRYWQRRPQDAITPPHTPPTKKMCKSDNSPAPRSPPSPKTCVSGWWCNNHLEKYEFVNGKDEIPYIMEHKKYLKPPTRYIYICIYIMKYPPVIKCGNGKPTRL